MPSVSAKTATSVSPRCFRNDRLPNRRSRVKDMLCVEWRGLKTVLAEASGRRLVRRASSPRPLALSVRGRQRWGFTIGPVRHISLMPNGVRDNMPVWADRGGRGPRFARLTSATDADVCVVGLGGSGLACIGELLACGVKPSRIVGVDAGTVASAAAGRNGGFLLAGTADFYHDAIANFGHARARRLYEMTIEEIDVMAGETPDPIRRTGSLRLAGSR